MIAVSVRCAALALASLLARESSAMEAPTPDVAAVREHLSKARALAGPELHGTYVQRCITVQAYPQFIGDLQRKAPLPSMRVFDQLFFVGQNDVSAWALDTTDGIVLFDALNGPEDVAATLVPGMMMLGLDPARIRYVVLTHAHGDHFGGVGAVKALAPGAHVVSTDADWKELDRQRAQPARDGMPAAWSKLAPERDLTVGDGETLKVGRTTLRFYVTPGHTPGTLTTVFDVADGSKSHRVALYGGLGLPRSAEALRQYSESLDRFAKVAREQHVDTAIANHQTQDDSRTKLEELRWRTPTQPHPYVLGTAITQRYYQVQAECGRAALGRMGLSR